ncbi:helix-turn-helix transcriptional regulator [Streptomyces sp. JH002]|uniref:helix-turn-helix domain-containing protein n=1 Tax=Streptomyces sp. JH002 TaxID=2763259 RepID=UPI003D801831
MSADGHDVPEFEGGEQGSREGREVVDPLLRVVGKQIKRLREAAGLTQQEFGDRIGYGVDQVSAVERGRRAPKAPFIDGVESVLNAGGVLKAIQEDIDRARFPARFRDFAKWEQEAFSLYSYEPLVVPGLLQTERYARALISGQCPPADEEVVEELVAARKERRGIFECHKAVVTAFVIEEAVLRRPVGGRETMAEQCDWLLRMGALRNVSIQIMPTAQWRHHGIYGSITLLDTKDGRSVAYTESQEISAVITDRLRVGVQAQRHGIIRMQALDAERSARLIERLAGEL